MAVEHLIFSDNQEQEKHQTKFKLSELYYKIYLNSFPLI